MKYELRAGKKLAVFWEENGEVLDSRKARSFNYLKGQKIIPVIDYFYLLLQITDIAVICFDLLPKF